MVPNEQIPGRTLLRYLLGLTDLDEALDAEQQEADLISKICRLLEFDVLYTVRSLEGGMGQDRFRHRGRLGKPQRQPPDRHRPSRAVEEGANAAESGQRTRCLSSLPGWLARP